MITSLRYRLLLGASLSSAAVLALLGLGVYVAMRHALMKEFDSALLAEARLLTGMIEQNDAKMTFEFDPQQMPEYLTRKSSRYFQIWRDDGTVLGSSPSLGDRSLERSAGSSTTSINVKLPGGAPGKQIALTFSLSDEHDERENAKKLARPLTIAVAAEPVEINRTLKLLGWLLAAGCTSAVVLMGVVLLRVVDRGVRPITALAGDIESLTETDLARRFSRDNVPDELVPVVDKLNGLLTRLQSAFVREKSFTADVAHELRTPLTGLRMTLEVCRSQRRDTSAYEMALDDCRVITDRMEAMIESLLMLARSDAGQIAIARRPVDLGQSIAEIWSLFQYRADRNGLKVTFDLPETVSAETDPDKLRIVLQNLMDNAVSYVNPAGSIRIGARSEGPRAVIEIANTGSRIGADDVPRLFERFWRGDVARTDAGDHCGLGLSLCQRLMKLLGGEISVTTCLDGEFVVRLTL